MARFWKTAAVGAATASMAALGLIGAIPAQGATAAHCTADVGGTGLSAALVAHADEVIAHRTIDAAGCDIGIFVGAGATHVTVNHVTVINANFDGILAQRTAYLRVVNSTVTRNGFHTVDPKAPALPGSGVHSRVAESFGISLFGVSHSLIEHDTVVDNGRGGIGVMDVGAFNPGARTQNAKASPRASVDDTIYGNTLRTNYTGCAIVVATQNPNGRVEGMTISENTVVGTGMSKTNGPDVGGIVVAANTPGSAVVDVMVRGNRVSRSFEGGIIVNAEAPGSFTWGVVVNSNRVTGGNNWGAQEAPKTAGIIVFANPAVQAPTPATAPSNRGTLIWGNAISGQYNGIWSTGDDAPMTLGNRISVTSGGVPIARG